MENDTGAIAPRLLCSTGAFTREQTHPDHRGILTIGPELRADGLEVIVYHPWYDHLDRVEDDLRTSDIPFPAVHSEKSIGARLSSIDEGERNRAIEMLAVNCRFARAIGADLVILHLWGLPDGDAFIDRNLSALTACFDVAAQHDVSLAIETILADHGSPLAHIRRARDLDDRVLVALDTEFLAHHGQLDEAIEADWLWPRVRHIHLKDYDGRLSSKEGGRRYLHPGQGHIDFPRFFGRIADRGYRGNLSLEAAGMDRAGHVDINRVQESLERIRGWIEEAWS